MSYFTYDGSFDGLLTAIFESYALKIAEPQIYIEGDLGPQLFEKIHKVSADQEKAERVKTKIQSLLGKSGLQSLWKATLSEQTNVGNIVSGVVRYALKSEKDVLKDYGHPSVLALQEIMKKLSRERHRMTAFVRFKLASDQIYYATIEPDFDVLPLISEHFKNRYADQKWMIFDLKRNYGVFYDLTKVVPVEFHQTENSETPALISIEWDDTEMEFQSLWKNYFKSTNIASRKNPKLHLQHVPKRYWKYLVEK
ncbi:TIGR03915 family putative DNA repair protein [Litoribacter ruber]|uniref:TIGR03915 family putative DNA repair protein n=1 Tax=Litoribacter ruber TaxID=702568 RepID=A0AAP2CIC4_9BACT|nr:MULTISPECIES: TIGR03915 family putative DNA repair protein [Litoribacter]MBS9525288.1 TIGR03915 family putative DNA repair protein [Litoribacter alkaliphilus]MBT0810131.1 TIGR03915 family putative DNA repair protein [Litoribacter ruber]